VSFVLTLTTGDANCALWQRNQTLVLRGILYLLVRYRFVMNIQLWL
jgi:hypothetical protein